MAYSIRTYGVSPTEERGSAQPPKVRAGAPPAGPWVDEQTDRFGIVPRNRLLIETGLSWKVHHFPSSPVLGEGLVGCESGLSQTRGIGDQVMVLGKSVEGGRCAFRSASRFNNSCTS